MFFWEFTNIEIAKKLWFHRKRFSTISCCQSSLVFCCSEFSTFESTSSSSPFYELFLKGISNSCDWVRSNSNYKNIGWERGVSFQIFESTYDSRILDWFRFDKNSYFCSIKSFFLWNTSSSALFSYNLKVKELEEEVKSLNVLETQTEIQRLREQLFKCRRSETQKERENIYLQGQLMLAADTIAGMSGKLIPTSWFFIFLWTRMNCVVGLLFRMSQYGSFYFPVIARDALYFIICYLVVAREPTLIFVSQVTPCFSLLRSNENRIRFFYAKSSFKKAVIAIDRRN